MQIRLPAEWEPQDGVLMAWPHANSDWAPYLGEAQQLFGQMIRHISRFETVLLVVPAEEQESVRSILAASGCTLKRLRLYPLPCNDTWARDFGPITVYQGEQPLLLDFGFNGWGLKFAADLDNRLSRHLKECGAFPGARFKTCDLILEGGSIESDGKGTLLTTAECLLNANRNPHLNRTEIEERLKTELGASRVLWLEHGYLAGDDTDSHIDTLVRMAPDHTLVYVECNDPDDQHYEALQAMKRELELLRTGTGLPFRLIALPWPAARYDTDGQRLPATYANFLVINEAVLVPTYRDRHDERALQAVSRAFPGREVIGIDCSTLILQHGSLHCVTMQLPKGVLG
ncbi:MAG: agmatine deiminase [Desulfuromonas sp.]|nr:MAG: agmatine deiminase [Desulfuromonas sp.]